MGTETFWDNQDDIENKIRKIETECEKIFFFEYLNILVMQDKMIGRKNMEGKTWKLSFQFSRKTTIYSKKIPFPLYK